MKTLITSLYWDDNPPIIPEMQKKVFDKFGYELVQTRATIRHGAYIDWVLNNTEYDRYLFIDSDCIPLSRNVIQEALDKIAGQPMLFGCAQASNHLHPELNKLVFAAPCFFTLTKETYHKLGRPTAMETVRSDVAAEFTWEANSRGIPVELWYPIRSLGALNWELGSWGKRRYGLGTYYGPDDTTDEKVFHMFEARVSAQTGHYSMFVDECNRILNEI